MAANFIKLETVARLDSVFESSHGSPVVLFKHSNSCGISADVFKEVSEIDSDVHVVVVQTDRTVSDEIERRTGIRHESPQAIVIRNGRPVFHASHYDITPQDIENSLE